MGNDMFIIDAERDKLIGIELEKIFGKGHNFKQLKELLVEVEVRLALTDDEKRAVWMNFGMAYKLAEAQAIANMRAGAIPDATVQKPASG